jgi:hypothetical protein
MVQRAVEHHVQDLERRVSTVEQILPTLATKTDLADLRAAMKADLAAAIAPLATKADIAADLQRAADETRRHIDVVAEGLRADIWMIAEGVVSLHARVDAHHAQTTGVLAEHDRRLTRLETSRPKRR